MIKHRQVAAQKAWLRARDQPGIVVGIDDRNRLPRTIADDGRESDVVDAVSRLKLRSARPEGVRDPDTSECTADPPAKGAAASLAVFVILSNIGRTAADKAIALPPEPGSTELASASRPSSVSSAQCTDLLTRDPGAQKRSRKLMKRSRIAAATVKVTGQEQSPCEI